MLLHGVVLVLKHRVFGGEMEYRDRIARLRERRRLEGYGRYEEDVEDSRDGRGSSGNVRSSRKTGSSGHERRGWPERLGRK